MKFKSQSSAIMVMVFTVLLSNFIVFSTGLNAQNNGLPSTSYSTSITKVNGVSGTSIGAATPLVGAFVLFVVARTCPGWGIISSSSGGPSSSSASKAMKIHLLDQRI